MQRFWLSWTMTAFTVVALSADNWPQWRGPLLNGVSNEKGLPVKWTAVENVAWKVPMPSRTGATPIIWNDRIFLNVALHDSSGDLELWCLNRSNGDPLWKRPLGGGNHREQKQNMSSPSPVTDGTHVWVMTGTGILKAFDLSGTEVWARDIQHDYGRFGLNWGYASSPLLHEGALYVQVLHGMKTDDPSYVMRIDKATGKTVWRVVRPTDAPQESPDSYTTPALLRYGNTTEIVITGGDVVTGHDLETGKELWRADGLNPGRSSSYRIIASPLVAGDVIIAPTRQRPMLALKAGGRGDITRTHKLWEFNNGPDVPTPVSDGKYLYVLNDGGVVYCLDLRTGATIYGPSRLKPGTYSASPTLADGRLYVTSEEGTTTVFAAGPKFEVVAENAVDEYTLSSIAVSQSQLFLRTDRHLYAIGARKP
jgi:outer membrane protein assembly factor BamB